MPHVQPTSLADLLSMLSFALRALLERVDLEWLDPRSTCELEQSIHQLFAWAADTFFGSLLSSLFEHTAFEDHVLAAKREQSPVRLQVHERRRVTLTLLAGHLITLPVRALRAKGPRPGRRRVRKTRGQGQAHRATPALEALGVVQRRSPAANLAMLHATTSLESYQKARDALERQGMRLSLSTLHRVLDGLGTMVCQAHERWLTHPEQGALFSDFEVQGRRVVVAFDGGRCRERIAKRGRKKKNGYRNFHTPWVEPRQLVIYLLDEQGKLDAATPRVTLASLDGPGRLFVRITRLFKALRLEEAAEVIVTADGQHWQWMRLGKALQRAGVAKEKCTEVLDMGHALSRLREVSQAPKGWSAQDSRLWYEVAKEHLKEGRREEFLAMNASLVRGRHAKQMRSLTNYFVEHGERIKYDEYEERKLPKGSGVVESTIRQVLNMRLKNCGKFWTRKRAERMMMMRGWQVSGRLEQVWWFALDQRVDWWQTALAQRACASEALAA